MKPTYYNWGLSAERPFVIRFQTVQENMNSDMDYDFHKSLHMNIVMQGDYGGDICGSPYHCQEGEAFITAPWEPHRATVSIHGAVCYMIAISLDELAPALLYGRKTLASFLSLPPEKRFTLLREKDLMKYCRQCGEEIRRNGEQNVLLCWKSILDSFISIVNGLGNLENGSENRAEFTRILPALHRINSGKSVTTAEEAARLCDLSTSRFRVLFKQIFRKPFAAYELNYRLSCAADDILNSRMTVKDAAFEWGFFDTSHFSRLFKQYFGCAPGQYKRNAEKKGGQKESNFASARK
ncbi:MAG: helix-turn-helix transcriptional regulator [Lentisphaeria bacterium]|nr:helix-turn-helix transcriptional regulator [Lentisphaeria bacterium]